MTTTAEIAASTDVAALWDLLQVAKRDGDATTVRAVEDRMRELAGHNTGVVRQTGLKAAVDPDAMPIPSPSDMSASGGF